jgi:hypothetical protein
MVDDGQIHTDGAGHYSPPFTPFTIFTEGDER